ncbi:MAG: transposase [Verrucomicrobiales bacterium]|nr:transposase [Verrucomicrobiales bacterium]
MYMLHQIHDSLRNMLRRAVGKSIQPSATALESQSVKTAEGGPNGFDAGKKINGRKRHVLVDTLGLLLAVCVTPASIQDRDGAGDGMSLSAPWTGRTVRTIARNRIRMVGRRAETVVGDNRVPAVLFGHSAKPLGVGVVLQG